MSDGDALLAAILANPDEDTPRLVYADWLDEQDEVRVDCTTCGGTGSHALNPYELAVKYGRATATRIIEASVCGGCNGAGSVVKTDNHARAEFIRVQCELASNPELHGFLCLPEKPCRTCNRITSLFVKMPIVPQTHPLAGYGSYASRSLGSWDRDNPMFQFTRGFVSAVTCTSADWLTHAEAIVAAHPVQKVTLTTWPVFGTRRSRGFKHHERLVAGQWIVEIDGDAAAVTKSLIESRWPGVEFVLPAEQVPLDAVTYDDPFPDVPWGGGI